MRKADIAVIGGGASGLAAAISAKRTNRKASVAVIEQLPKTGKKILATGNGRCNLSNTDLRGDHYYGSCCDLLKVTAKVSVPDFFAGLGVLCEDDGYGRIYPRCRSAASVLDALRLECSKLGVEEICGFEVKSIDTGSGLVIRSDNDSITASSVIIAGGGKSQSALGSNGSMLDICRGLGIKINEVFPALVPLKTDPALVKPLKGQRADAKAGLWGYIATSRKEGFILEERGEVQFTDGLISGICVLDLSFWLKKRSNAELRLDLLPDMSMEEVIVLLTETQEIRSGTAPEDWLSGIFTRPMGAYILKRALGKLPERTCDIHDLAKVAKTIKSFSFPITGTAGFERSQVTDGGIALSDPATYERQVSDRFELAGYPGMYACGEILDICGVCGGYNLDFAFSSGVLAGRFAASDLYRRQ